MEKETLKKIFNFIEKNDNRNAPLLWKLENDIPLSKEELEVEGNLNLENSKITSLPEGFYVKGNLDLSNSKITSLPKGLKVGGKLLLIATPITSLPEGLKVDGVLCCYRSEELKSLPKGVKIGDQLDIRWTKITLLPRGLEVGGLLRIGNTELEKYTDDELREMVKPGFIKGEILR
jgi:hypothetical protein